MKPLSLIVDSYHDWRRDRASILAAALAYYALFAIGPIFLVLMAGLRLVVTEGMIKEIINTQLGNIMTPRALLFVQSSLEDQRIADASWLITSIGFVLLLIVATGFMTILRTSLNTVWHVEVKPQKLNWSQALLRRLYTTLFILLAGLLLLIASSLSVLLSMFIGGVSTVLAIPAWLTTIMNNGLFLTILSALLYFVLKHLSDAVVQKKDAAVGAVLGATLLFIGKVVLTWYFENVANFSTYGVAGTAITFLVWVYFSAQAFMYSAVFTRVFATTQNRKPEPRTFAQSTEPVVSLRIQQPSLFSRIRIVAKTLKTQVELLMFALWLKRKGKDLLRFFRRK